MATIQNVCELLRKGWFREFAVRSLNRIVSSIERRACNRRCHVRYEDTSYYSAIVRNPRIRLNEMRNKKPRLNVLLPSLDKDASYAGIKTALDLAFDLSKHYDNIRFTSLETLKGANIFDFNYYVAHPSTKNIEVGSIYDNQEIICHENEVFFCTLWQTVMAWESYSEALTIGGFRRNPFYYYIQDFEPGFFPLSYRFSLAHKTYSYPEFTHAIFNSSELHDFFKLLSFSFKKEYVLRPSLIPEIFDYLKTRSFRLRPKEKKMIRILIYGRPKPRNCFESILDGLNVFFRTLSPIERKKYLIVSVGAPHENILISGDTLVRSLGKLSVEQYIDELEKSHIGIFLAPSPHPGYIPLEMATFGLYTITNKFFNKDLSMEHPLIHSLSYPLPVELAKELKNAVDYLSRVNPDVQKAVLPRNMCLSSWRDNIAQVGIQPILSNNLTPLLDQRPT